MDGGCMGCWAPYHSLSEKRQASIPPSPANQYHHTLPFPNRDHLLVASLKDGRQIGQQCGAQSMGGLCLRLHPTRRAALACSLARGSRAAAAAQQRVGSRAASAAPTTS
jgi:hypothetical protein